MLIAGYERERAQETAKALRAKAERLLAEASALEQQGIRQERAALEAHERGK